MLQDSLYHIWLRFASSHMYRESGLNPTPSHQISYCRSIYKWYCKIMWPRAPWEWLLQVMNRLSVYRYLTRYPYGHSGSDRLFTVPLPDSNISVKKRCWTRQKLTNNYQTLRSWWQRNSVRGQLDIWTNGQTQDRLSRIWRRAGNSPSQIINANLALKQYISRLIWIICDQK